MANPTWPYVAEYNNRQRLQKLGFVHSLEQLDALTAEYFVEISRIVQEIEERDVKDRARQ